MSMCYQSHSTNSLCVLVKVNLNSSQEQMGVSHSKQHERQRKRKGSFLFSFLFFFTIYLSLHEIKGEQKKCHVLVFWSPRVIIRWQKKTSEEEPWASHLWGPLSCQVCAVRVHLTKAWVDKCRTYLEAIRSITITYAPLELKNRLLYLEEGSGHNNRWWMCKDCHKQRGENCVFAIISTLCAQVQLCREQEKELIGHGTEQADWMFNNSCI